MTLDPQILRELTEQHTRFTTDSATASNYLPASASDRMLANFAARFGPDRLAQMRGPELLLQLHGRESADSLMYWLEFKKDDEFPARSFGSISGGSAFKFEVYQRAVDGAWVVGPPQNPRVLSEAEAIEVATRQRDGLVQGARLLNELTPASAPQDFVELQAALNQVDAELFSFAWVHKYLCLIFPTLLDDYHSPDYQRFHLIELGVEPMPSPEDGCTYESRYVNAGLYLEIASELNLSLLHLTQLLNDRARRPSKWFLADFDRLGLSAEDLDGMVARGIVSPGFAQVSNLVDQAYSAKAKQALKGPAGQYYVDLWRFRHILAPDDIVVVRIGGKPAAVARVLGDYEYFAAGGPMSHRRAAAWRSWPTDGFEFPAMLGAFAELGTWKWAQFALAAQLGWRGGKDLESSSVAEIGQRELLEPLSGPRQLISDTLDRRRQVILYGPPGTGKTYWGVGTAKELAARRNFGKSWSSLSEEERDQTWGSESAHVRLTTFHPSYGYEDFIEGYRPAERGGQLLYELTDGVFKRMCSDAAANPDANFYLVVDEINRGDVPRIFGELITLIEADKRGPDWPARLPLSGTLFWVPRNLFLIGTMNTADRSITVLDSALRRRFGFVELMPDYAPLADAEVSGIRISAFLRALNRRVAAELGADGRNLQVGHAYFITENGPVTKPEEFVAVVADEVFPLVQEYCYGRQDLLSHIFGDTIVNPDTGQIQETLRGPEATREFLDAVLTDFPELSETVSDAQEAGEDADDSESSIAEDTVL